MAIDLDDLWILPLIPVILFLIFFFTEPPCCSDPGFLQCAEACREVKGQRLASCRGCDWFLDCGDVSRQTQCPAGQLFDVTRQQCRAQREATCGVDGSNQTLAASSAFVSLPETDGILGIFKGIFG